MTKSQYPQYTLDQLLVTYFNYFQNYIGNLLTAFFFQINNKNKFFQNRKYQHIFR